MPSFKWDLPAACPSTACPPTVCSLQHCDQLRVLELLTSFNCVLPLQLQCSPPTACSSQLRSLHPLRGLSNCVPPPPSSNCPLRAPSKCVFLQLRANCRLQLQPPPLPLENPHAASEKTSMQLLTT